jgi:serine/threonine protein kinase
MRLGRYRLIRQLAIGGMAEVYLATATGIENFEKLVVLKRILPQHAQNPRYVSMFLDEARLAATLHHPNVVQVFDIGSEAGLYYFTMEYAHGEDVRTMLARAQRRGVAVPLGVSIAIALDVCRGLHYAHERRDAKGRSLEIVHRDVTPSNAIVTFDGVTKLLDFGVAKSNNHQTETSAGSLKGKIGYLSPEQCLGEPIDRRSDIFALGILLYELTTGTRLFRGPSDLQVLQLIAHHDAPSPRERNPDCSPGLERIVMHALARRREDRYATALAVQRDLEELAREQRLATSSIDVADFLASLFPRAPTAAVGANPGGALNGGTGVTGLRTPTPLAITSPRQRARSGGEEPSVRVTDYIVPGETVDGEPAAELAEPLEPPLARGSASMRTAPPSLALFDLPPLGLAPHPAPPEPPARARLFRRVGTVALALALALAAGVIVAWRVQVASPGANAPELAPAARVLGQRAASVALPAPAVTPALTTANASTVNAPAADDGPLAPEIAPPGPPLDEVLIDIDEPEVIKRRHHRPRPARSWDADSPLPPSSR